MELYSDGPPRSRIKRMFGSLCNWPSLPEERSCACGCFNSIIEIMQELRTAAFEHAVIEALKSELRNRLSVYSWINVHLWRLKAGYGSPRILAIRKLSGDVLGFNASFEYVGNFHVELVICLPAIVERLGLSKRVTCRLTLKRFAGCVLITFSDNNPYPHMRFSFRRMPRFFIKKQFFTPEDAKIQSWILSWIIDFAIICDLRSKTLQPLYSMKDVFRPRQWHLLQLPEAVHIEGLTINVEIVRVSELICSRKTNIFCISTAEDAPWIHMDLVDLQPVCRFMLFVERCTLFPGLVSVEEENTNLALGAQGSRVIVSAVIPSSDADRAKVLENDVILEINGVRVKNSQHAATLLDDSADGASILVERRVTFKWSRSHYRQLPRERSIKLSTLQKSCQYPQSSVTTGSNFQAVIGAPCDIIANAGSKRFQYIRTDARQESGEINTTFRVTLQPDRRYINFGLWAASKSQPELLGYGSMHLYACLAHCLEAEGPTIISLPLGHPDRMTSKLVPRTLQKHIRALGFNSRLCHGNIELRMTVIR